MMAKEEFKKRRHQEYLRDKSNRIKKAMEWQAKNPLRQKKNHQKWQKINRARCCQYSMLNFHKNREKWLARMVAFYSIPIGIQCEVCASTELLERHHPDYSHPTIIVTLCKFCHEKKHADLRRTLS